MATFRTNSYAGRQLRLEVWQDGGYLKWILYSEGGNSNDLYTIYNLNISIAGQTVYNPGTVTWSTQQFPAATGSTGGSVWVGHSATYRELYVSFIGAVYWNRTTQNGGNIGMGATISLPSLSELSINTVSDISAFISFNVNNANNGNVFDSYIDLSLTNFGGVVKSITSRAGTFTKLEPNRTYYVRGNAANEAGRSYTQVSNFTTGFIDPGAPSNLSITYNKNEPIPTATYTFSWNAGTAGSTPISGYRFRLYKNNTEILMEDIESTATSKTINGTDYNFSVGDVIKFGLYSYSKDWTGNKHFNGGGTALAHIVSDTINVVSDKYIYVSVNGASFDKKKMYISVNGGSFIEVKKEKFKTIK